MFTWRTPADTSASRVSIDIVPGGTGCGLTLTHDMDPRWTSWMPKVEHGWRTMLDAMARALERGRTAGAAGER